MSSRRKAEKKLLRLDKRYETEQLMRVKRSEEYEVLEDAVNSNGRF